MFEVAISSPSISVDKEIDKYHDSTSDCGSSSDRSGNSSSGGNTTDE